MGFAQPPKIQKYRKKNLWMPNHEYAVVHLIKKKIQKNHINFFFYILNVPDHQGNAIEK